MGRSSFLTVSFRLRRPTARKQAVLDQVYAEYNRQVKRLLDWAEPRLDTIREEGKGKSGYTADSVRPCLPSNSEWEMALSSPLKDGAFSDACAMIASFLALELTGQANSWPTAEKITTDEPRQAALDVFGSLEPIGQAGRLRSEEDIAETALHVDQLLDVAYEADLARYVSRKARIQDLPLTYTRGRDFDLLLTDDLQHPYVYLPLLPNKNDQIEPVDFSQKNMLTLWSNQPGITPVQAGKRRNGLLLPLELGKRGGKFHWQFRKFVLAMLDGNATPKSAKVVRRNGQYYINISVSFEVESPYEPRVWIGIADNFLYELAYALVDLKGTLIIEHQEKTGILSMKMDANKRVRAKQKNAQRVTFMDYKRKAQEEVLHVLINRLLDVAQFHGAGIAMIHSDGVFRQKEKKIWSKAETVIAYKCKHRGIPCRTGIFAARAGNICVRCGSDAKWKGQDAVCARCGSSVPIGVTKSVNIARRVLYRKSEWDERGGYREFHRQF